MDAFRSEIVISDAATAQGIGLLVRLRAETRAEHDAIEHALNLTDGRLTLEGYRQRVEQFYGFYKPLEERMLVREGWISPWLDINERVKTPLLAADLKALGSAPAAALPLCGNLPGLEGPPECFGCLYVLEGSTLGGQVISRHLREKLNVTPGAGGLFFDGYGHRTGLMWQQFRLALTGFCGITGITDITDTQDRVVTAARLTFETLRHWCQHDRAA